MASATESSLISKLQSSASTGIHALVSDYLRPFSDLNRTRNTDQTLIRSLAKRFLPFINASLSILPKRLPELSKSAAANAVVVELFQTYKLCLDCLDAVASQLACKRFTVEFQRVRLMHCFDACGRAEDAEVEGLMLLEKLRSSKSAKRKHKILPEVDKGGTDDKDFCLLVVEIVVVLVRCAAMGLAKEEGHFRRVLDLVEQVRPWLRCVLYIVAEWQC